MKTKIKIYSLPRAIFEIRKSKKYLRIVWFKMSLFLIHLSVYSQNKL